MDVKFDSNAAERLLVQMNTYCSGIQKETIDLLAVMKDPGDWQDNQMRAFQANIDELSNDLRRALELESEYMRTFKQRIMELKG